MKKLHFCVLLLGLLLVSLIPIIGCGNATGGGGGGGVSNRSGVYSYSGTQSPGDAWTWTISTSEFTGSNETTGMWVTGEWTALSSGFGKATILSAGGPGAPSYGDHAYFLEIPDTMLLILPDNPGDERIIICNASATLEPTSPGHYLYVNIPKQSWNPSDNAFGTVEAINSGSGHWIFKLTKYLITGEFSEYQDTSSTPPVDFVYSDGTLTDESGTIGVKVFMTPSNVFIEDDGNTGGGGSAGASYEALTDLTSVLNHTYKGFRFVFYPGSPDTGETQAVTGRGTVIDGFDAWKGKPYSNIDTGAQMTFGVKITFEASPQQATGFVPGIVTDLSNGYPEIVQCVVSRVGPAGKKKYLIFGIGLKSGSVQPFNFLLLQTDG